MKRMGIAVALLAIVSGGCGTYQAAVNTSTHAWSFPKSFQGVPVHRIAWNEKLPYLYPQPWRIVAPKTFTVSPTTAVKKAAQYGHIGWRLANLVYVQPAGLVGGNTGSPPSVYLVELVGANLGGNYGGPDMPKPPTLQFAVVSVNGRTGAVSTLTGGEVHGVVRGGRVLHLLPEPASAKLVAEVPRGKYPDLIGLAGTNLPSVATSVWHDGSVAEYGVVWDPLYVFTQSESTTSYISTNVNYATSWTLYFKYNKQYACPRKIGKLYIIGIKGSTVAFKSTLGTGTFDLSTHRWSFNYINPWPSTVVDCGSTFFSTSALTTLQEDFGDVSCIGLQDPSTGGVTWIAIGDGYGSANGAVIAVEKVSPTDTADLAANSPHSFRAFTVVRPPIPTANLKLQTTNGGQVLTIAEEPCALLLFDLKTMAWYPYSGTNIDALMTGTNLPAPLSSQAPVTGAEALTQQISPTSTPACGN